MKTLSLNEKQILLKKFEDFSKFTNIEQILSEDYYKKVAEFTNNKVEIIELEKKYFRTYLCLYYSMIHLSEYLHTFAITSFKTIGSQTEFNRIKKIYNAKYWQDSMRMEIHRKIALLLDEPSSLSTNYSFHSVITLLNKSGFNTDDVLNKFLSLNDLENFRTYRSKVLAHLDLKSFKFHFNYEQIYFDLCYLFNQISKILFADIYIVFPYEREHPNVKLSNELLTAMSYNKYSINETYKEIKQKYDHIKKS